jgi:ubiquinone/menaquinone biosynthesis C-methylase UbiE
MKADKEKLLNIDSRVVDDFGKEWKNFNQGKGLSESEKLHHFSDYFSLFPWSQIPQDAIGFDAGCGSGRWASLVLPRVGHLHCIDPSEAIHVAQENLSEFQNCSFHKEAIHEMRLDDSSMDFGYSLGVLHHLPNPLEGMIDCVRKLKSGAPFLVYLYYAMDNQPRWFRLLWKCSDYLRKVICIMPSQLKIFLTNLIALIIYFPTARMSLLIEKVGFSVHSWPLSNYRDKSFYTMRTDALDRFGTRLEYRFRKEEIVEMLKESGLEEISISESVPYYCAIGYKK